MNSNRLESEALKFSNQWTYLKTMKEVREYEQYNVGVEDFKAITRNMEQKEKSSKRARKLAKRQDRVKKLVRTEDLNIPGPKNYLNYTLLKESRAKTFNVHKEDTKWKRT